MGKRAITAALVAIIIALTTMGCASNSNPQKDYVDKMTKGLEDAESVRDAANSRIAGYGLSAAADDQTAPTQDEAASAQDADSYEAILADYTARIREASPRLVDEFNTESQQLKGDKNALAQLSNDKISELAKISNEGTAEMAKVMRSNGDDYSVYEEWAGKLSDAYLAEADAITDAYIKAAA